MRESHTEPVARHPALSGTASSLPYDQGSAAVGHSILVIAWHLLANDCDYADLGTEHFSRHTDPEARKRYLIRQLEALGHTVTVEPSAA